MTHTKQPKLVLLDRDGVINVDRPDSVKSMKEFELLPRVGDAIQRLNQRNISVAVVTNQAVVGRGVIDEHKLNDIHQWMADLLGSQGAHIDQIYVCTSADASHPDRKPNPGLLTKALTDFDVAPQDSIMIGDALRDLQAAHAVQCPFFLVKTGKGKKTLEEGLPDELQPVTICNDLWDVVESILGNL